MVTPNIINADDISKSVNKNMGFLCIRVYLYILYYALLSQKFKHLLLYDMHCYHYYNVS